METSEYKEIINFFFSQREYLCEKLCHRSSLSCEEMAEILGTVVSTVQGLTAAATHQEQQQQSGEYKPEQQQSSIDMESGPVEPPNVRMHI